MIRSLMLGMVAGGVVLAVMNEPAAAQRRSRLRDRDRDRGHEVQGSDFHWKGKIATGKSIEIRGINGDVRAIAAKGDEVEVTAVKWARRSDPEEVKIEVVEHSGGVTICAVYPSGHRYSDNECSAGGSRHNHTEDNDVSVEFTVQVPAGVVFDGNSVNGDVNAESLKGDVFAHTVNGGIEISTSGYAEAETVNGSIRASSGTAKWPDRVDFRTVNGGITLDLPEGFAADVTAETVNGEISSDFPLTISGRFGPRRVSGKIGAGGPRLSLGTVNGNIRLRKGT